MGRGIDEAWEGRAGVLESHTSGNAVQMEDPAGLRAPQTAGCPAAASQGRGGPRDHGLFSVQFSV